MRALRAFPGKHKENSKEICTLFPAYYFILNILRYVLSHEIFAEFVGEFLPLNLLSV